MRAPRIVLMATVAIGAAVTVAWPVQAQDDVAIETLLARAGAYVARFIDRFSNVVTEERYEQTWDRLGQRQTRVTRSDLIFVKSPASPDWSELRDVFEVDGRRVRDRESRLLKLFTAREDTVQAQVRRILAESARYNIGPVDRTTNTPVFPLIVLTSGVQRRFSFSLAGRDETLGRNVRVVTFRETARPTLVVGNKGEDRDSTGRFWLDVDTGEVLKSEMNIEVLRNLWTLTTLFRHDQASGVAMPVEMREHLEFDFQSLAGVATYGRFRTFAVSTDETVRQKQD